MGTKIVVVVGEEAEAFLGSGRPWLLGHSWRMGRRQSLWRAQPVNVNECVGYVGGLIYFARSYLPTSRRHQPQRGSFCLKLSFGLIAPLIRIK